MTKLTNASGIIADDTPDMANLESFFSAWLLNHIEPLDAQLVSYIRRQ